MRYVGEDIGIWTRLGSALTYLTAGWGGFIALIVMHFAKKTPSRFFKFNVYQSIIIAFSIFVIGMGWAILYNIFSQIPLIQILVSWIDLIFNKPVLISRSITELFVLGLTLYCVIFSIMGKYPIIYKVSRLINRQ